jgi:hypothetical protein
MTTAITVYCDDPSHGRWTRYILDRGDDGVWRPIESWLKHADSPLQLLSAETLPDHPGIDSERYRYRFWCDKCDDTVAVIGEKLMPIFDRWAAAGQREISLRSIRRVIA